MLKMQFFLRVNKRMGLLVTLIVTCFQDVFPFVVYLGLYMVSMTVSYKVLGFESPEYPKLKRGSFTNYFLYAWENSIGNIHLP